MGKNNSNTVVTGLLVVGIAALLLWSPSCQHGCRTVAEHLFEHGLKTVFGG